MKKYCKSFTFWGIEIQVSLINEIPEDWDQQASAGVSYIQDKKTEIWFKEISDNLVAHECWHLFMHLLEYVDNKQHYFSELNSEIYAYDFQELVKFVTSIIKESPMYEELKKK